MANKGNNNQSAERSRVRVIIAEAEGTSAEIQQLIVSVATALRPQQVVVYPQQFPAAANPAALNGTPKLAERANLFDDFPDAESVPVPAEVVPPTVVTPSPKPQNGTKRKYRSLSPIPGLEFTSGAKPLKGYIDEQAPEEHSKRYLAILFWLREYRSIAESGGNHIFSCYKALNLNPPDDALSIFRSLKKQGWVMTGSKPGLFKLHSIGEGQLKKAGS